MSSPGRSQGFAIAASIFALDRATKWIIEARVPLLDRIPVIPGFFDIVHSQNSGAAFGMFSDSQSPWRTFFLILFSIAALVVVGGMLWNARKLDRPTFYGISLIFGGAMGNVFDRIAWGRVTDFLEFYLGQYAWPAFNVADSAIVVGSGLLVLDLLKPRRQAAQT
jgi:signal peptidase II